MTEDGRPTTKTRNEDGRWKADDDGWKTEVPRTEDGRPTMEKGVPPPSSVLRPLSGGEGGIRTREGFHPTRFPGARTRPDYATSPRGIFDCQLVKD